MSQKINTIFLTIFEGVEAKNILRAGIVEMLLRDENVRVVLLTKNYEKVLYYKNEFARPRVYFEAVEFKDRQGLDALFSKLKFTLLRTKTTDLKRKMARTSPWSISYFLGFVLNVIVARKFFRKMFRLLDEKLIKTKSYQSLFEKYEPSLAFCAHIFDERESDLLREAKARGVQTVALINSWDKVTARCAIRVLPDKTIVFNEIVKGEMVLYGDMDPKDIFVSGLPQYDVYWHPETSRREDFLNEIGLGHVQKLIVYAPNGHYSKSADGLMIDILHAFIIETFPKGEVGLLVRFQPNDFVDMTEIRKRPWLTYEIPGIRFSSKRGVDWDMDAKDIKLLTNTLAHSSLF